MNKVATTVIAGLVLAAGIVAPANPAAGGPVKDPGGLAVGPAQAMPHSAVPGSTPQRRAAWERLTPAGRQQALARFQDLVGSRMKPGVDAARAKTAAATPNWAEVVSGKVRGTGSGPAPAAASARPMFTRTSAPPRARSPQFDDPDGD